MTAILGIETSCDETSAAVLKVTEGVVELPALVILSQDVHRVFGGVVPELASREHLRALSDVVDRALEDAGVQLNELDGVAVTAGPGLVGALLVGVMYGKTLAFSLDLPLIGVHHLEGHLFAPTLEHQLEPPFVALLVSGGHTMLLDVERWGSYRLLGRTLDDAAGEAFDKVAKLIGLGYPGGPEIERQAAQGDPGRFRFPRPLLGDLAKMTPNAFNFSFSGLKTAVLRAVKDLPEIAPHTTDLARGFQDAVLDVLVEKTARAAEGLGRSTVVLGGGVACNRALATRMIERLPDSTRTIVASPRLNTDNAGMIAAAGAWRLAAGQRHDLNLEPRDDLAFPGLVN